MSILSALLVGRMHGEVQVQLGEMSDLGMGVQGGGIVRTVLGESIKMIIISRGR